MQNIAKTVVQYDPSLRPCQTRKTRKTDKQIVRFGSHCCIPPLSFFRRANMSRAVPSPPRMALASWFLMRLPGVAACTGPPVLVWCWRFRLPCKEASDDPGPEREPGCRTRDIQQDRRTHSYGTGRDMGQCPAIYMHSTHTTHTTLFTIVTILERFWRDVECDIIATFAKWLGIFRWCGRYCE